MSPATLVRILTIVLALIIVEHTAFDAAANYQRLVSRDARVRDRFVFITGDTLAPETPRFIAQTGVLTLNKPFLTAQVRRVVQQVLRQG